MSDQFFWFATRSAGIMAWFAATASIVVGLLMSTRVLGRKPTIPWLTDLHRYFGAMSVVFLAVHMITLWADSFVQFRWADLFVPFVANVPGLSRWSLALGVIAGWLLFVVEASSLLKDRLPPQAWHTIHLTSFGVMLAGGVHGLEAGSDSDNRYLLAAAVSVSLAIAILGVVRVARLLAHRKRRFEEERESFGDDGSVDLFDDALVGNQVLDTELLDTGMLHDAAISDVTIDHRAPGVVSHPLGPDPNPQRQLPDVPLTSGTRLVDTDPGPPGRMDSGRAQGRFFRADDEAPSWLRNPEP